MCNKTDSDIGWNTIRWFIQDYRILNEKDLGLPNCLFCGVEPREVWTTEDMMCEHRMHIGFKPCGHVVGYDGVS